MKYKTSKRKIAILGGGPSGLFMYKRFIESGDSDLEIHIFERKGSLGAGMPYSEEGANDEHITNVSDNEIPEIFNSISEWVKTAPEDLLHRFKIIPEKFNEYKVLPRLFFGVYLSAQFDLLCKRAKENGILTEVHLNTDVTNLVDDRVKCKIYVETNLRKSESFDHVIICTGHSWPKKFEGKIPGYYDSPYPPVKLKKKFNHTVAIKGASLTAVDAIRTIARSNGNFTEDEHGKLLFSLNADSPDFKIIMHSRNGLLPAVRFHLEDSHLDKNGLLSKADMACHIKENQGFISLDFVFEKNFKEMFIEKDPEFYDQIKEMDLETFVDTIMNKREKLNAFDLFKMEYEEAEKSIQRKESIYWKEMLAVLSFTMNYPAKYLSAEDMQRLQKVLMPLISIVIAFVPQSSCRDLMALYDAGLLSLIAVGDDSTTVPAEKGGVEYSYKDEHDHLVDSHFETFINCIGQPHLSFNDFPFQGLIDSGTVSPANLRFRSQQHGAIEITKENKLVKKDKNGQYYMRVPGITINDSFQVTDENGVANNRIYIMAVPYIGGYNPDYSGIDFSEAASLAVLNSINNKATF